MGAIPDRVLRRVRALLAKAERTEHAAEAESFNATAHRLIAEYGIEAAMLDDRDSGRMGNRPIGVRFDLTRPYARGKLDLITGVASSMGCKVLAFRRRRVIQACQVWGYPSDVERAGLVFLSLLVQAEARVATERPSQGDVAAYRRAWWSGFTVAIVARIRQHEQNATLRAETRRRHRATRAADDTRPVSVVLADRAAQVAEAMNAAYEKIDQFPLSAPAMSHAGMRAGHEAGHEADLHGFGPRPLASPD